MGTTISWRRIVWVSIAFLGAMGLLFGVFGSTAEAGPNIWTGAGPRALSAVVARDGVGNVYAVHTSSFAFDYGSYTLSTKIYRSTDGGENWAAIGDFTTAQGAHYAEPTSLAASEDGSVLLMAVRSDRGSPSERPQSLLKSTDGGATWKLLVSTIGFAPVYGDSPKFVFDPTDPSRVYASGKGGFYRSMDGGSNWQLMPTATNSPGDPSLDSGAGEIAVDPANPARILAMSFSSLKVSDNFGVNWRAIPASNTIPRADTGERLGNALIFVARQGGPSYVLAVSGDFTSRSIYLSKDAGETWQRVLSVSSAPLKTYLLGADASQGRMFVILKATGKAATTPTSTAQPGPIDLSPQQNNEMLYTSNDGENWSLVSESPLAQIYVSQRDPQRIFRGDGAFSRDGGRNWSGPSDVLPLVRVGVSHFDMGEGAWLSSRDENLWRSTDRGRTWTILVGGDDFFFDAIRGAGVAPRGGPILAYYFPARVTGGPGGHLERQPVMMRSTDDGANWKQVAPQASGYRARFSFEGEVGNTVYAAISPYYLYGSGSETSRNQNGSLLKSTDAGATWVTLPVGMVVNNVLLDPADARHIWAAGDDGLAESLDAGTTWRPVRTSSQVGGLIRNEPGSSTVLYAYGAGGYSTKGFGEGGVIRGSLYKSTNGGGKWAKVYITGAPANYILRTYAVGEAGHLAVAWSSLTQDFRTPVTVSESTDGGETWHTLTGLDLGSYFGEELAIDPQAGTVYASGCCDRLRSYNTVAVQPDQAFSALWQRYDVPVRDGAPRSWTWGPGPVSTMRERMDGLPGDVRTVQYYDKSRMEVNDPSADRTSPWFVTNGLLTVEMVAGRVQVGLDKWEPRAPSFLPVAGDAGASNQPSYASFRGVASYEGGKNTVGDRTGANVTQSIDAAGVVGSNIPTATVKLAMYDREGGHNIAAPFWEFLNRRGQVFENGVLVQSSILGDWLFVMGHAISEPYWTRVQVADRGEWVLVQLFERRVLTYTPSNPAAWQVEMGNVGLHYYLWRYGDQR